MLEAILWAQRLDAVRVKTGQSAVAGARLPVAVE
jgi:hypothetical protein